MPLWGTPTFLIPGTREAQSAPKSKSFSSGFGHESSYTAEDFQALMREIGTANDFSQLKVLQGLEERVDKKFDIADVLFLAVQLGNAALANNILLQYPETAGALNQKVEISQVRLSDSAPPVVTLQKPIDVSVAVKTRAEYSNILDFLLQNTKNSIGFDLELLLRETSTKVTANGILWLMHTPEIKLTITSEMLNQACKIGDSSLIFAICEKLIKGDSKAIEVLKSSTHKIAQHYFKAISLDRAVDDVKPLIEERLVEIEESLIQKTYRDIDALSAEKYRLEQLMKIKPLSGEIQIYVDSIFKTSDFRSLEEVPGSPLDISKSSLNMEKEQERQTADTDSGELMPELDLEQRSSDTYTLLTQELQSSSSAIIQLDDESLTQKQIDNLPQKISQYLHAESLISVGALLTKAVENGVNIPELMYKEVTINHKTSTLIQLFFETGNKILDSDPSNHYLTCRDLFVMLQQFCPDISGLGEFTHTIENAYQTAQTFSPALHAANTQSPVTINYNTDVYVAGSVMKGLETLPALKYLSHSVLKISNDNYFNKVLDLLNNKYVAIPLYVAANILVTKNPAIANLIESNNIDKLCMIPSLTYIINKNADVIYEAISSTALGSIVNQQMLSAISLGLTSAASSVALAYLSGGTIIAPAMYGFITGASTGALFSYAQESSSSQMAELEANAVAAAFMLGHAYYNYNNLQGSLMLIGIFSLISSTAVVHAATNAIASIWHSIDSHNAQDYVNQNIDIDEVI